MFAKLALFLGHVFSGAMTWWWWLAAAALLVAAGWWWYTASTPIRGDRKTESEDEDLST